MQWSFSGLSYCGATDNSVTNSEIKCTALEKGKSDFAMGIFQMDVSSRHDCFFQTLRIRNTVTDENVRQTGQ